LNESSAGTSSASVAIGAWTLSSVCAPTQTEISVLGPEYKFAETESLGVPEGKAEVLNFNEGRGVETNVVSGKQELLNAYIYSATAMEHLELEITDEKGGLFNSCTIAGSATPAS
jgi:hypothetical protein